MSDRYNDNLSEETETIREINIVKNSSPIPEDENKTKSEGKKKSKGKNKKTKAAEGGKGIKRSFISHFDLANRFKHWYMGGISITRSMFRVRAAWQGVIIISSILAILFIISAFYTGAGEFVISLDSAMSRDGFYLSNTEEFNEKLVCLRSNAVVADNISVFDIDKNVINTDGVNDGSNYVAHTFYLTNETGKTKDYEYKIVIRNSSKGAEKALWVMVFHNGVQTIYALAGENGEPEKQYSIFDFPFSEYAEKDDQYNIVTENADEMSDHTVYQAENINRVNELVTTPFVSDTVICQGERDAINNKEVDKYTVVMWYEGEDPQCNDDIVGGWVEVYMAFDYVGE